jgi:hypothetical protein
MKRITIVLLIITIIFTTVGASFANEVHEVNTNLITLENGKQVTVQELIELLNSYDGEIIKISDAKIYSSENLKDDEMIPKAATVIAIPAWAIGKWVIPFIGTVIITPFAIYIGNVIVDVGTALFNSVISAVESIFNTKYKDAKKDGIATDNHSIQNEGSLPVDGQAPNSSKDLKDRNGSTKQRRYYDKNGNADLDIDYHHGGTGHTFPHRHDWNGSTRGPAY